jgi:UDP-glucose 4-epimerase
MRVFVLGGSGFLGSHIVDRFVADKHDVWVYDLYTERYRRTPSGVRFVTGDFGNVGVLNEVISTGFDTIVHCVSTTTPKSSNESAEFDIQSNVIGTVRLMDICVRHGTGKLVFLSSGGTVYGDVGDAPAISESHPVEPICSYGVSKVSIEQHLSVYQHLTGLNYVSLRVSNPYGERQSPHRALGALTVFLYRTLTRQPIEIWGDGSVIRDFIYAGDVASAVYQASVRPLKGVFNVGTGTGTSLRDLLAEIARTVDIEPKITWLKSRPFDAPRIVLDCTKFEAAAEWTCLTGIREGISKTAEWLRRAEESWDSAPIPR